MISNLKKRGFEADYVPDRQAALRAIAPYLTKGNTVSCGGSITLTEIGFNTAVKEADCIFLDRTIAKTQEEKDAVYSKVAVCDYYFMSTNAITTDGLLVNIDGTGNRVASTLYGHKQLYLVAGVNKIAENYDKALWRARNIASPKNAQRLHKNTPCALKADKCYDCKSPERICCGLVVLWEPMHTTQTEVVLIGEELGY